MQRFVNVSTDIIMMTKCAKVKFIIKEECYFKCMTCDVYGNCTLCFGLKYNQTLLISDSNMCNCMDGYFY